MIVGVQEETLNASITDMSHHSNTGFTERSVSAVSEEESIYFLEILCDDFLLWNILFPRQLQENKLVFVTFTLSCEIVC